jgi:hypothetical protein
VNEKWREGNVVEALPPCPRRLRRDSPSLTLGSPLVSPDLWAVMGPTEPGNRRARPR